MRQLFLLLIACTALAQSAEPPDRVPSADGRYFFWISARAATGRPSKVGWDFHKQDPPGQPCGTTIISSGTRRVRSWDDVRGAKAIYRGIVTRITPGFAGTIPESLLTIQIERTIRAAAPFPTEGVIHAQYPVADFIIGRDRFCNAAKQTPSIGSEVIVFTSYEPYGDTRILATSEDNFFFLYEGRLSLPRDLAKGETSVRLDEVEAKIRRLLR